MNNLLHRRWWRPIISAAMITLAFLTPAQVAGWPVSDGFMLAAAVVAGWPILVQAIRGLRHVEIGIDLLVSIASIGAIILGNVWEAAAVTFLFAIGKALEDATLSRTRAALGDLVATAPDEAVVLRDGEQVVVPASSVVVGETVLVKTGAKVPVDGRISEGAGAFDEASITGESLPVDKSVGDQLWAGTLATGGLVQVTAQGVGADTTLARIIHRVEEAQEAKAPTEKFMDRFSRWYTPAVIVLALVAGLLTRDVTLALTLLVIGCPGALVISIPVAIVAGIGRGAREGLLVKGGEYLERTAKITAVALDKTGTLTQARPELTDVVTLGSATRQEVLGWAARIEAASDHPLAQPIVAAAQAEGLEVTGLPDQVEVVIGRGLRALVTGREIAIGNPDLASQTATDVGLLDQALAAADSLAQVGRTPMILLVDGLPLGVLGVADAIRPEAPGMVAALHQLGIREVMMLTGDQPAVAQAVADRVGIDSVRAGLLPEDKLDAITALQQAGHVVAMVGDGVNDAPALATADIGVAMGAAGSAVAIETADIALMTDELSRLPRALGLARRTVAVMRQNIIIAIATVGMLLAGVLFGGVTMSLGMFVHEASVLLVIANAMRLLRPDARWARGAGVRAVGASDLADDPQSSPRAPFDAIGSHPGTGF